MMLFVVLGSVFLLAVVVIGFLFYLLSKESSEKKDEAVAITDLNELRKTLIPPQETKSLQVPIVEAFQAPQEIPKSSEISVEFHLKEESYQKKVAELEGELQSIASKAQDQSKEALATIEQLKQENEQLKGERNTKDMAVQASLIQAQQTIDTMHEEQLGLQNRLNESQAQVGKLQEEILVIKQQVVQEIANNKLESEHLVVENEGLKRSLDAAIAEVAKNFQDEIQTLKQENQTLKSASQELTVANQKFKELNDHLVEKSDALQWELTKARAQMTSFERACENYKNQLQGALDRTGSIEESNLKLNETNNHLQIVLEDLKKKNDEFAKREKLFEFELEKNRDRLVSLEREYANLKANISIQSDASSQG